MQIYEAMQALLKLLHADVKNICSNSSHIIVTVTSGYHIKTHGSESRGQEEAACMRVFWPTRPLQ